jgi:hypothetical protein
MDYDPDKVDQAVLALLYLTLHDGRRAWKTFDWDAMNRRLQTSFPKLRSTTGAYWTLDLDLGEVAHVRQVAEIFILGPHNRVPRLC